jgi:cardiolipin synthase
LLLLLNEHYWTGLILLAVGRGLDIVDGAVAQKTNTKSPLGEIFDAAADKFGTLFTIIALFAAQITFWWVLAILLVPQVVITLISFYKKARNASTHPTRQGKLSMASLWAALIGFIVAKALDLSVFHPFVLFVYLLAAVSTFLAAYAAVQYARQR